MADQLSFQVHLEVKAFPILDSFKVDNIQDNFKEGKGFIQEVMAGNIQEDMPGNILANMAEVNVLLKLYSICLT